MPQKIMVAMSGGVDSSVCALLLKNSGYSVCGVTMRMFENEDIGEQSRACCSLEDVLDAREVCDRLGIPHRVFRFCEAFRDTVIRRFANGYLRGETPNPCIDCNRYVKIRRLLERARLLDYDGIATGHYARVEKDAGSGRWLLKKAADTAKDQTYVLYALTQDELSSLLLPLGDFRKGEIREMAEENGFPNAGKPDSQDICFVKDGDYAAFLESEMGVHCPPGEFVDAQGQYLGTHRGIHRYTVGQRKGLGISAPHPLYVTGKDVAHNRILLGEREDLYSRTTRAKDCNWIAMERITGTLHLSAKARYTQCEAPCDVSPNDDGSVTVVFREPQRALTPGQAIVFYDGDTVVGGGTIDTTREKEG